MPQFPHLPLPKKITAPYKYKGVPIDQEVAATTLENLQNRLQHGKSLIKAANSIIKDWESNLKTRRLEELPDLPNEEFIPILIKVDASLFDPESLYSIGIQIVAEDEDGFIIGASADNFKSLKDKIDKFIAEEGNYKNKAAQLWEIETGTQWRLDYILSPELNSKWDKVKDDHIYTVDVSVSCSIKIPNEPSRKKGELERDYKRKYKNWQERKAKLETERDKLEEQRQAEFGQFISDLDAAIISDFIGYNDSFCCRLEISGSALKDLVTNYQFLFDVTEYDVLKFENSESGEEVGVTTTLLPPPAGSPAICIIDSGMQEAHPLLAHAIDTINSRSYLPTDTSVFDGVAGGGHGTKVAGAVLYGNNIPKAGTHQLDIFIKNARVLNDLNTLPKELFPPQLMQDITADFDECKVFNLSINSLRPCKKIYMSKWAAAIDKVMLEKDKLFIVSIGNIKSETGVVNNPGIKEHYNARRAYPDYLTTKAAKLADPSQSCFALTVGAICSDQYEDDDKFSFGSKDLASSFTRSGPGIWRMIKPDVVEYGGDFIREKGAAFNISTHNSTSTEVVKKTTGGVNAIGYDVGTSFAAPKVSHIAGRILNNVPNASANLLRALIVQSARLPGDLFRNPHFDHICLLGNGIPDKVRASENSERRITLIAEGEISAREAQIYTVKLPEEIRRPGNEYEILMEVTLTFMASPRRSRQRTNQYLSTWVDWQSSKYSESYLQFKKRITKYIQDDSVEEVDASENDEHIKWKLRENVNWGSIRGLRRQDSSIQKDWTILRAFSVPAEFSIGVVGHKGWEKDADKKVAYSLAISFEVLDSEVDVDIYSLIRLENEIELPVEARIET